jgi:hypothetical protein
VQGDGITLRGAIERAEVPKPAFFLALRAVFFWGAPRARWPDFDGAVTQRPAALDGLGLASLVTSWHPPSFRGQFRF